MSVVITVAPTGPIASKADNPELPTQPEEIAEEVHQAYLAGASVAHIHLRDRRDQPTADLNIARRTMDLIAARAGLDHRPGRGPDPWHPPHRLSRGERRCRRHQPDRRG